MNVDQAELDKFGDLAHAWWDPDGELKTLHDINPVRLDYIDRTLRLPGRRVVDVGCGGGLLAEGMAKRGAQVIGIDASEKTLNVARLHLLESALKVDYQCALVEDFARTHAGQFDCTTCLELLEHVPDPESVVSACGQLVKPGGHVFFSTLNRNLKAYMLAVLGAEYVLGLLPRGTHDYAKFIKPSELARFCRKAGLEVMEIKGMRYNPYARSATLSSDTDVNYLMHCIRR